jgi:hypothetical protein
MDSDIKSWVEIESVLNIVIRKQETGERKINSALPEIVESWISYEEVLIIVLPSKEKMNEFWKTRDVTKIKDNVNDNEAKEES